MNKNTRQIWPTSSYRNMTFCDYYPSCADQKMCPKKLTAREEEKAKEAGQVVVKYAHAPCCYKPDGIETELDEVFEEIDNVSSETKSTEVLPEEEVVDEQD